MTVPVAVLAHFGPLGLLLGREDRFDRCLAGRAFGVILPGGFPLSLLMVAQAQPFGKVATVPVAVLMLSSRSGVIGRLCQAR
jgi:hypothetical protein